MQKNQQAGFFIVIGLLVVVLFLMMVSGTTTNTVEISYSNFIKKVQNGEISKVGIEKNTVIAQPKKQPEIERSKSFQTTAPDVKVLYKTQAPDVDTSLIPVLKENNVDINVKKMSDSSGFLGWIGTFLPLLFLIGIMFVIFRPIQ